jgi:recombination protein RecA
MGGVTAMQAGLVAAKVGRGLEGFSARLREPVEVQPCGIAELDALLGGGFPRGSLVEVCGSGSSGRTSLSLALLAQATQRQETCAFVDVSDALDPMSVAAAGVEARRLLWVRCGGEGGAGKAEFDGKVRVHAGIEEGRSSSQLRANKPFPDSAEEGRGGPLPYSGSDASRSKNDIAQEFPAQEKPHGFAWTHPRDAMRGVETSIPGLMRRPPKVTSYEEMSFAVRCAGEQVEPDRQPPRRGENLRQRFLTPAQTEDSEEETGSRGEGKSFKTVPQRLRPRDCQTRDFGAATSRVGMRVNGKPWKRLEQALKATDLLLHSGGWGVVVVDLGGISWVEARRIPMHTWFRFRRVVENSPTILLLLGEESCAKSCASLVLQCRRMGEKWSFAADESNGARETNSDAKLSFAVLRGFEVQGEIVCSRMQRLEVNAARWQTRTF